MSLGTVISLCDETGNMVEPWLEAGYEAITVDLLPGRSGGGRTHIQADVRSIEDALCAGNVVAAFAFTPCTNSAVSGARWFKDKGLDGLIESLTVLNACKKILESTSAPWMIENPVSTFSTYWRKPDHIFHPWQYTFWCRDDHYTKKTCLWTGNGFVMPEPLVSHDFDGEPDDRIHKAAPGPERAGFRSATPKGFSRAVFLANAPHLRPMPAGVAVASQVRATQEG